MKEEYKFMLYILILPMLRQLAMTMMTGAALKFSEAMVSSGSLKLEIRMQQMTRMMALNTMISARLTTMLDRRNLSASSTASSRSRADGLASRPIEPFLIVTIFVGPVFGFALSFIVVCCLAESLAQTERAL